MNKKIVKKYLRDIKIVFPVYGKEEKRYLDGFKDNLLDYVQEYKIESKEELYEEFGSPKDVVTEYLNRVNTDELIKKIRKTTFIKKVIFGILVLIFLVNAFKMALIYKDYTTLQLFFIKKYRTELSDV